MTLRLNVMFSILSNYQPDSRHVMTLRLNVIFSILFTLSPWQVRSPTGLLPGFEIEINYADSKCSGADAMNEAINFYVKNKLHLFLGPCCDYAAAPIGRQTK